jgi:hypothetical protein
MENKTQFINFRLDPSLYADLRDASRLNDLSCLVIARKGLRLILQQMRLNGHSVWHSSLQGDPHERV